MRYGNIKKCDIADGPGVRVSLFVSGCRNHCPNCFQPETWDFNYGKLFTDEIKEEIFAELSKSYVRGITLLGGEPMEPENQRELLPLILEIREKFPNKDIWMYTGYTIECLSKDFSHPWCEATDDILKNIDVLVDGRFIEELKDVALQFRGSSNQRIIDMRKSDPWENKIVLWNDNLMKVTGFRTTV